MTNINERPGCLAAILSALGLKPQPTQDDLFPYRIRDDFLSPAEKNFYHVLQTAVSSWAVIFTKVSLDDLFYAKSGDHKSKVAYRNKIARKHIDFLLCDPQSLSPLLGIELDDASHQRTSRQERDRFVEQVFAAAGLPLHRVSVEPSYNLRELAATLKQRASISDGNPDLHKSQDATSHEIELQEKPGSVLAQPLPFKDTPPACPKCGQPMVLRVVKKESLQKGKRFWGCQNFPRCRGLREYKPQNGETASTT